MSTRKPPRKKSGRFAGIAVNERQAQRRRMLVDAGIEIFGTRGYHVATVREICAEAKLTERYFYESFANREALYAAAYEELTRRLRDKLVAALMPAPRDVGGMARAALHRLFSEMRDDPRLMRILFVDVFTVSEDVDRLSQRTTVDFARLVQSMVEALYPDAQKRNGIDPALIAQGLVGACMNLVMQWAFSGYEAPLDAMVRNAAVLFEALGAFVDPAPAPVLESKGRASKRKDTGKP